MPKPKWNLNTIYISERLQENRMPGNVHLIIASRDRFLPAAETVRLGGGFTESVRST